MHINFKKCSLNHFTFQYSYFINFKNLKKHRISPFLFNFQSKINENIKNDSKINFKYFKRNMEVGMIQLIH